MSGPVISALYPNAVLLFPVSITVQRISYSWFWIPLLFQPRVKNIDQHQWNIIGLFFCSMDVLDLSLEESSDHIADRILRALRRA